MYLVNVFICPSLDHTQGSHYYRQGGSFKVPHIFFNFPFHILVFTYLTVFFDMLLFVGADISIRSYVFLFSSLNTISVWWFFLLFFTSVLDEGFSLEFEWQQVSLSLQDSSQYSGCPQQCCHLDSLYPSANFQVLQAL